jgi:hypothetical protein
MMVVQMQLKQVDLWKLMLVQHKDDVQFYYLPEVESVIVVEMVVTVVQR